MFKSAKRRCEKSKIKAVFQLQFQATQVPQVKAKALTVSLVPVDVGKPTVRLEKAAIVDGTCFWENPVYETVKFIRDPKNRKFKEKYYHFIVSTGSSKAGLLGEVPINFADYAEAAKPSTVSLPLNTSNHGGPILHVTIHNMQDSVDLREADETPTGKSQDRSLKNQLRNSDRNGNSNPSLTEDGCINKLALEISEDTWNFRDLLEEDPTILQDDTTFRRDCVPKKRTSDAFPENGSVHHRSNTDWSMGSASDGSMVDIPNSSEENLLRDRSPETCNRSDEKFIRKISMLERQAELSELELQSLRKQIVKESKRGQDLLKIDLEQRAMRAEEALRKTRSTNAVAAERIQAEFRRLSAEMSSKLDENEKMAMKAVAEANDLRTHKRVVEEILKKVNEELILMKEQYEEKLQVLSNQTNMKVKQIEQMSLELEEKDTKIENLEAKQKKKRREESYGMALMKTSVSEQQMLQKWIQESEELKKEYSSVRKEAQKLQEESNTLRSLKDEKDSMVRILQSDIEKLRFQYSELKHSLFEVELEKENLRKEVFKLEGDLQKKEEAIISTEKKLQNDSKQARNRDTEPISSKWGKSANDVVSEKLNLVELTKLNLPLQGKISTAGTDKENGDPTAPVIRGIETFSDKGLNVLLHYK